VANVKKKSSSKQIIDHILDRIQNHDLKAGDKLPNERTFAETLGVSRVPLREAISALSLMGILDARQGEGTFVNKFDPSILGRILYTYSILDNTSMDEIVETRKIMEATAAKVACKKATEDDMKDIQIAMERRDHELDLFKRFSREGENVYKHDNKFHHAIALATHNHFFVQFLDAISYSMREEQAPALDSRDTAALDEASEYHHRIFSALASRDGNLAYDLMYQHIQSVQHYSYHGVA